VAIRTIPIDPDAEIPPPRLDRKGRPRWVVRFDRTFLLILYAFEFTTVVILLAVFLHFGQNPWLMVSVLALILATPLVMHRLCRLTLALDDDHLRWVFFPFWAGRIPYASIETVEPCTYSALGDFGGWGPKVTFKHFGLISGGTKGVLIKRFERKRDVVASCSEPESLALELLRRIVPDDQDTMGTTAQ